MSPWTVQQLVDAGWDQASAIAKVSEIAEFERTEAGQDANRPTVSLSAEAYRRIEEYAKTFGISIQSAASKAITRWMDESGEVNMRVHKEKKREQRLVLVV